MGIAGALIGAVGSIVSGNRAADAQTDAANAQIASNERIFGIQTELAGPYRTGGNNALAALQYELGMGPRPEARNYTIEEMTRPGSAPQNALSVFGGGRDAISGSSPIALRQPETYFVVDGNEFATRDEAQRWIDSQGGNFDYQGYQPSEWYNYQLSEGQRAIDGSAAARGNLFSSATLDRQQRMGQGLASADYGNYLNRLTGIAGMGQAAAAGQAANAGQMGIANSNAIGAAGNAQAAGAINTGNALAGLGNNISGWYGYQNAMNGGGNNATMFDTPWASGGFWG